jgi:hypothetical protein
MNSVTIILRIRFSFSVRELCDNHSASKGQGLGKKRRLLYGDDWRDLRGGFADETLQGVGEMCLIEVA